MTIKRIISSNALGADSAAVDIARCFNIPCDGYSTTDSKIDTKLKTCPRGLHQALPEIMNSTDKADASRHLTAGTLIFSFGPLTGYLDYIHLYALTHGSFCLHLDLVKVTALKAAYKIDCWTCANGIEALIVTGMPMHADNRIYRGTYDALYSYMMLGNTPDAMDTARHLPSQNESWPQTVCDAVQYLIRDLSLRDKATIANMSSSDLIELNHTLGCFIRNKFGLDGANHSLWWSCAREAGRPNLKDEEASAIIISYLALELQKTHKLRLLT